MSENEKAMEAARLYSNDSTYKDIADKLEISKSHAQVLTRRGIDLIINELKNRNPGEMISRNPSDHQGGGDDFLSFNRNQLPFSQDPRTGPYMLETSGIGRRVLLTPKDIMIFDLWKGAGFKGDLSDFISDSINFMYETRRPRERINS